MTQATLDLATDTRTHFAAVKALFEAKPHQWIDGKAFEAIGGRYSWSARIRDCRKYPYRMVIENRQIRVGRRVVRTEYRWVP
jgi:hypothetical protein